MAIPPFNVNESIPGDDDIVSQFPAQNRSNMDIIEDWLTFEHDASGHHKIPNLTTSARDSITDWVVGSLIYNTTTTRLEQVTSIGPVVWVPAMPVITTGTWTPTLQFSGASVGVTYAVQVGRYVRVGDLVHLMGRIELTGDGSSVGDAEISGLPFAAANITGMRWGGVAVPDNIESLDEFDTNIGTEILANTSLIKFPIYQINAQDQEYLDDGNFNDSSRMTFGISYLAA